MKTIIKENGLIHRIIGEDGQETVFGNGLTDYDYLILMRTFRKYRNQLSKQE